MKRKVAAGIAALALAMGGLLWAAPASADEPVPTGDAIVQEEAVTESPDQIDSITEPESYPTPTPTPTEPPEQPDPLTGSEQKTEGGCVEPLDGTRWETTYERQWTQEYVLVYGEWVLGEKVYGEWYEVGSSTYPDPYCEPEDIEVTPWLEYSPPTCDEAGSVWMSDEGVVWGAVLNDDGSTTYTASPADGYTFPEGVQTQWTVPNLDQLSPEDEQCYVPPTPITLNPPTVTDECGTKNDMAFLPEAHEGVTYQWASDDETNLDIVAVIAEGYVVETFDNTWVEQEDGTFLFAWTYEFSDEPCATPPPTPTPPAPPTLAATGGGDVAPLLPLAGGVMSVLGAALALAGWFRRRSA